MWKKISFIVLRMRVCAPVFANDNLLDEVREGLDLRVARMTADDVDEPAAGQLGGEVYESLHSNDTRDFSYFPHDYYMRIGGGVNLDNGWNAQIGFGWNLSSFIRAELDLQDRDFNNDALTSAAATVYFDLARRYIITGDIIRRRTFIPFVGIGIGAGNYKSGDVDDLFVAPRGVVGLNLQFSDMIGLDFSYQYQMLYADNLDKNISDIMRTIRIKF